MDIKSIKEKILNGELTDESLYAIFAEGKRNLKNENGNDGFMKTIVKGFYDGYTTPNMLKVSLEALLILVIVVAIVILSYAGRIDMTITAVLFALILGFLFGKIK